MNLQACVQRQDLCAVHTALEETRDAFTLLVKEPSNLACTELLAPVGLRDLNYMCMSTCMAHIAAGGTSASQAKRYYLG